MDVKWLIENEVFQYEDQSLIDALEARGIEYKVCEFERTYEDITGTFMPDDCVVVHGSLQLGREVQRKTRWIPGVYCNLPQFECVYYYPRFGDHLLNADYMVLPFGTLKNRRGLATTNFGSDDCVFLRPSSGFKTFTGRVVELIEWYREMRDLSSKLNPETLVLVCRPIEIVKEWRLVVTDRVIAHSQYKEGEGIIRITGTDLKKIRETPPEVIAYGEQVLKEVNFHPDPIWTLDICKTAYGDLKVLEVGSFSCAGLYACDPEPIIDEVNKLAWREYEDSR